MLYILLILVHAIAGAILLPVAIMATALFFGWLFDSLDNSVPPANVASLIFFAAAVMLMPPAVIAGAVCGIIFAL